MYRTKKNRLLTDNDLIYRIIKDDSITSDIEENQVLENIVFTHFFCSYWYPIVKAMYERNLSIGETLAEIWKDTSVIGRTDMINIVVFAAEKTKECMYFPDTMHPDWFHFCDLLESMYYILSTEHKRNHTVSEPFDRNAVFTIIEAYKNKDVRFELFLIYQVIINNWVVLKDRVKVYNLLQSMAEVQNGWRNLPSDRIELLRLLKEVKIGV